MQIDQMEAQVVVRIFRGAVLAAAAFLLAHMQTYFNFSSWLLAMVFGLLGLMHSTERVARIGLAILIVLVLIPPSGLASVARWLLTMRNGTP